MRRRRKIVQGQQRKHRWTRVKTETQDNQSVLVVDNCACGLFRMRNIYYHSETGQTFYTRHDMSGHVRTAGHCTRKD